MVADIKWGTPVLGAGGGNVQWNADLSSGLQYDDSLYELGDFEQALRDAFQVWEDAANINFVESNQASEIEVSMTPLSGSTVGLATLNFFLLDGTDLFDSVDIELDSSEMWAPYGETDLNFYAVAAHEIGHGLGLLHVDDETQIMHDILFVDDLNQGDKDGAVEIYGDKPEPVLKTNENTIFSFFEDFFNLILSLFGLGPSSSSSASATAPTPWADTDGPSLADVIDITEIIDGTPGDLVTITHAVPHPDHADDWDHDHGCTCHACCVEAEYLDA